MADRAVIAFLAIAGCLVLAGCTAPDIVGMDQYDESASAITPAPIPDTPEETPTPTPSGAAAGDADERVAFDESALTMMRSHEDGLHESYTVHERQMILDEEDTPILYQNVTFKHNHTTHTRYLSVTIDGPLVETRFNTTPITEERWVTPNESVRSVTYDNDSIVRADDTSISLVTMSSPRTGYWARIAATGETPATDIYRLFSTFHFAVDDVRWVNAPHNPLVDGFRPAVQESHLVARGLADPQWLIGTSEPTKLRYVAASVTVHDGMILKYDLVYSDVRGNTITTTDRTVEYRDIGNTTITLPPPPEPTEDAHNTTTTPSTYS